MPVSPEETVGTLIGFLNRMPVETAAFIKLMSWEHRTLQQAFTGVCLAWIRHMASLEENLYDGRNEYSVKICKEIIAAVPNIKYGVPLI